MKRYMLMAGVMAMVGMGALSGCGSDVGQNKAKEIALSDAGVNQEDASRFRISKDREDGVAIYEVEFDVQEKEYSYEIKASDGEILSADVDVEQSAAGQASNSQQGAAQTPNAQQGTQNVAVSEEDAKAAALERVEGAGENDLKMKLDFDDGQYIYEGDIIYNGKEYEFEIDANTGTFLKWSEEKY